MSFERALVARILAAALLLAGAGLLASCSTASAKPEIRTIAPAAASGRYTAEGKASYYGKGFDGKRTASGEKFDRKALTAAHPSLPFGTRLRVTNLDGGKSVVVRINDRFGGKGGRIIDLSEGSFARIAPLEKGVIRVRLEQAQ